MPTAAPLLLRRKVLADLADPDYAATQVPPGVLANVADLRTIVVFAVARDNLGAVVAGTCDLQLVSAGVTADAVPVGVVWSAPPDLAVGNGDALEYDVSACKAIAIRVVADAHPGATTLDIFWVPEG